MSNENTNTATADLNELDVEIVNTAARLAELQAARAKAGGNDASVDAIAGARRAQGFRTFGRVALRTLGIGAVVLGGVVLWQRFRPSAAAAEG